MAPTNKVALELNADEAPVLYEWLANFNEKNDTELEEQAERLALYYLEASLEKVLVAPFSPDYGTLLADARKRVRSVGAPGRHSLPDTDVYDESKS